MQNALAIAAAIGIFVLMSFVVEGNRTSLPADQAARQQVIDAQFYQHQRDAYSKPAVGK